MGYETLCQEPGALIPWLINQSSIVETSMEWVARECLPEIAHMDAYTASNQYMGVAA